jgi:hypothetical protein
MWLVATTGIGSNQQGDQDQARQQHSHSQAATRLHPAPARHQVCTVNLTNIHFYLYYTVLLPPDSGPAA